MLHKKSFSTVEKNKNIWAKNLIKFQQLHKSRGAVPLQEFSLEEKSRIPLKRQVVISFLELKSKVIPVSWS